MVQYKRSTRGDRRTSQASFVRESWSLLDSIVHNNIYVHIRWYSSYYKVWGCNLSRKKNLFTTSLMGTTIQDGGKRERNNVLYLNTKVYI